MFRYCSTSPPTPLGHLPFLAWLLQPRFVRFHVQITLPPQQACFVPPHTPAPLRISALPCSEQSSALRKPGLNKEITLLYLLLSCLFGLLGLLRGLQHFLYLAHLCPGHLQLLQCLKKHQSGVKAYTIF